VSAVRRQELANAREPREASPAWRVRPMAVVSLRLVNRRMRFVQGRALSLKKFSDTAKKVGASLGLHWLRAKYAGYAGNHLATPAYIEGC
jgi:hypothetical protein